MNIYIACDHNGIELKTFLIHKFNNIFPSTKVYDVYQQTAAMDDYPIVASILAENLKNLEVNDFGIAICGTGQGICMALNRYSWVRSACPESPETAQKVKAHNHANCICFGGWQAKSDQQKEIVWQIIEQFIQTEVDNHQRHLRRLKQLSAIGSVE